RRHTLLVDLDGELGGFVLGDEHRTEVVSTHQRRLCIVEVLDVERTVEVVGGDGTLDFCGLGARAVLVALVAALALTECHHKLSCPPEEPWPPAPRVVSASPASSNDVTSTNSGSSTR